MYAEQFLDELEKRGLLDDRVLVELREQVSQIKTRVTPESIAKLLVDNGHLTRFQATKLVGEITGPMEARKEEKIKNKDAKRRKSSPPAPDPEEELGLAPDDDAGAVEDDEDEIVDLEEAPAATPTPAAATPPYAATGPARPIAIPTWRTIRPHCSTWRT